MQIAPIQSTSITNRQFLAEEMKMYLVERDDYVRYSDGKKLEAKDLSVEQRQFLSQLNLALPLAGVKVPPMLNSSKFS